MKESNQHSIDDLNERSKEVFRLLVESYLNTGDPVGSRTLTRSLSENVSAATIRNVMNDLEFLGLLNAPHVSAGRIPTESGLRLFVDGLLEVGDINTQERKEIDASLIDDGVCPKGGLNIRFSTFPSSVTKTTNARSGAKETNSICLIGASDFGAITTLAP